MGYFTVMRISLRLLSLVIVSLLMSALASGLTLQSAVSAATPGTGSLGTASYDSCALKNGQAYCWGWNDEGQLGNGTDTESDLPVAVDTSGLLAGKTLNQVSTGNSSSCALDSSGAAYCWGDNGSGQLGDGNFTSSATPVAVGGVLAGHTLTQIGVGDDYACALDSTGAVYCWGANDEGQLGDGSEGPIEGSDVPVAVEANGVLAGKAITQISVATYDVCVLDAAGAAYCWGFNFEGEFGNGTYGGSDVPVAGASGGALAGVPLSQIAMGERGACALDMAGHAYCWGEGDYGELGDGNTNNSTLPVAVDTSGVLAGQSLSQIAVNTWNACAVSQAGAAYCWGDNSYGQLGNGSSVEGSDVPVAVDASGVLSGVKLTQATVGYQQVCAEDAGDAVYCWGGNGEGQLGDGSTISSSVPVVVGPPPPTGVQARPGSGLAAVSWTASAGVPSSYVTGYTATVSPSGETCSTSGATACTVTGLSNGSTYSVTVVAHTAAFDSVPSTAASVTPQAGPSSSTTSITSTTASPVVGQPITAQATVKGQFSGSGSPTPTGAVTVSDGSQSCQATLSGSDGVASGSCQLSENAAGTYSFSASYPGDSNFSASQTSAPTTVMVGQAKTTTSITSSTASAVAGQPVTTAVQVSGQFTGSGAPAPAGAVTVHAGAQSCHATLSGANGVATGSCQLTEPAAGSYAVTATYPGNKSFAFSHAPTGRVTVARARSQTTLQLSAGSVAYGTETSLTMKVTVAPQFTGTPSGKVKITAGQRTLCTAQLAGGTGTCSLASPAVLGAGKATLVASYPGDLGFRGSTAGATLTVRRATTRTTLLLSASSVRYGHEMSAKIAVAVAPQFTGAPTGNVVITAGQLTLCTVRLDSGTHTCTLPTERALSPGRHVLVASYRGGTDFVPSSAAKALTVDQAITPGTEALTYRSPCHPLQMVSLHPSSGCLPTPTSTG